MKQEKNIKCLTIKYKTTPYPARAAHFCRRSQWLSLGSCERFNILKDL